VLLALDLGVFHRRAERESSRAALGWSAFWIALSLLFNGWIWLEFGREPGLAFFTGYLLEKALSVDNIFVFLLVFRFFAVPSEHQHRVLFWGVVGAIFLRAAFVLAGAALLHRFEWIFYLFGAFLLWTGVKLMRHRQPEIHPAENPLVLGFRRIFPITSQYHGGHFFVRREGRWLATPLMLVLVMVEATDVVFAVDSIPAIFGVTTDPFLVFSSNILAVLGLRALYFVLRNLIDRFRYLGLGLGLVLAFIGAKMLLHDLVEITTGVSLAVVVLVLTLSVVVSWLRGGDDDAGSAADQSM
jgi:tellurite resistance protein TerC